MCGLNLDPQELVFGWLRSCQGRFAVELLPQTNAISEKEKLFKASCLFWYVDEWEKEPVYWNDQARRTLQTALTLPLRAHRAKNTILFLGDGELATPLNTVDRPIKLHFLLQQYNL